MNETYVSVTGNVATAPVHREMPTGPVTRFRLAVTARHMDRTKGAWVDGHTNFFTVWAWRSLGVNTAASLSVGEPVVVQGKLKVRRDERGGQHWSSADIEATAIGHDLSRGTAAFRRVKSEQAPGAHSWQEPPPGPSWQETPSPAWQEPHSAQPWPEQPPAPARTPVPAGAPAGPGLADGQVEGTTGELTAHPMAAPPDPDFTVAAPQYQEPAAVT
ncbi:single-stranded DNA-binding protein [Streptomyces sp. NA04227]|uniref:single-stranded DNA-binding protein n=1 Tax=Streptomyces sp. NA04227 TaxID=2742136 RepID=UPI001590BF8F|nr:single-stranded DNA-binding protein [Streptomyces sp. NA04227]QKW06509.1 single-stranded DNA-binding protein [Streptomyces sp. NA04227]